MKSALRASLAVVAGMALAFVLLVAVEFFSSIVHPIPAGFTGTMADHVRRYPQWVLAVVVPLWSATALAATWTASRIDARRAGALVALLLTWAIVFNLTKLPYPMWFKLVMFASFVVACLLGIRYGARSPTPAAAADGASRSR